MMVVAMMMVVTMARSAPSKPAAAMPTLSGHPGFPLFIGLLPILFFLAGCAGSAPQATTDLQTLLTKQAREQSATQRLNEQLFARAQVGSGFQSYRLGPGDLLSIAVYEDEDLGCIRRLGARGCLSLPLLGEVQLGGLTLRQAEQKIRDCYAVQYLQNPHVTVVVKERYGSTVSILGQVTEPGSYDSLGSRRLMDFLALAGGLTDDAGRQVQVRRFSPGRSTPETFLIDLDRLVHQGHPQLNISIQGGDAIYVPRAGLVYVDGAVRSPGNYPIEAGMTVQEAIVAAGGFAVSAQTDSVTLIRMMDSGHREVVELSSGRGQSAEPRTLEVQERDVIFVPRSAVRDALYSVRLHFLGSLVGFGFEPPPR